MDAANDDHGIIGLKFFLLKTGAQNIAVGALQRDDEQMAFRHILQFKNRLADQMRVLVQTQFVNFHAEFFLVPR